ncbi:site-specific integrase [Nocardia terpenica]|uniref:Tyr recombinase domain-containing protein n=1 Tax=Nocardia terpenica TaxID=455432 RepID=A0A164HCU0_9NOCA|nr:site-specific integrase [Nocardia terpenica]KZM68402.1 hypothetical protein AWN90_10975 [Nocardia terpenica]NQE88677.1 site-specific integrase [Nocardia terpenica]
MVEQFRIPNPRSGRSYPAATPLRAEQYQRVVARMPSQWRVLTDFLVISGARLGEAAALADTDLDPDGGACRIERTWRPAPGGWVLTPALCPRTIALPANLFPRLDLHGGGAELFRIEGACGPGLMTRYRHRIWRPAVAAVADDLPGGRRPGVAVLRTTCGRWLADAGVPWPVIAAQLGYHDTAAFATRNLDRLAPTVRQR